MTDTLSQLSLLWLYLHASILWTQATRRNA